MSAGARITGIYGESVGKETSGDGTRGAEDGNVFTTVKYIVERKGNRRPRVNATANSIRFIQCVILSLARATLSSSNRPTDLYPPFSVSFALFRPSAPSRFSIKFRDDQDYKPRRL